MNFLLNQVKQIRNGDFNLFIRKIFSLLNLFYCLFVSIIFIPFFLFLIIISKKYLVRFGEAYTSRIGHFAANIELYLLEKKEAINVPQTKCIDFFISERFICNKYLFKIWKKKINFLPFFLGKPIIFFFKQFNFGKKFLINDTLQGDRDIKGLLEKYRSNFTIPKKDIENGFKEVERLGLTKNSRFVCLIVRDDAYLNITLKKDWSYHNYRDCNIQNYHKLSEMLAKEKIYTVRMGKKVNEKFTNISNPYIIDYANSEYKNDFLDIFLNAQCMFAISTGCGLDSVPAVLFRKKMLFLDIAPIGFIRSYSSKHIITLKNYYEKNTKKKLTLKQIFDRSLGYLTRTEDFQKKSIYLKESTPSELAIAAKEMLLYFNRVSNDTIEDKMNQKLFWKNFKDTTNNEFHALMHEKKMCKISSNYLKNNLDILD